ncbi:MAG: ABC-type transport auxiliary lipoprotein family protein [Burkholderiaceae bacterium]
MSRRLSRPVTVAFVLLAALLLAACSLGASPVRPALFDLGPAPAPAPAASGPHRPLRLLALSSPAWLDSPGIAYRLEYADAYRREVYRDSRWAAAPGALLAERLRQRFAQTADVAGGSGAAPLAVRLELEEFGQRFAAPTRSEVQLRARAWLVDAGQGAQGGQAAAVAGPARVFDITLAAPQPDALGAVQGLSRASEELARQLQAWADAQAGGRP